jgi:hypothetical protein
MWNEGENLDFIIEKAERSLSAHGKETAVFSPMFNYIVVTSWAVQAQKHDEIEVFHNGFIARSHA